MTTPNSEEKHKPGQKRWRRWLRRFAVFCLIVAALFFAGLAVLTTIGGNNDALRLGLQDYLTAATGMTAEIGQFNHMKIFPVLDLDVGAVTFTPPGTLAPAASIGKARLSMRFWDMFFSRGRVDRLDINEFEIIADGAAARRLRIGDMSLVADGYEGAPALVANGHYGDEPFSLRMKIDIVPRKNGVSFKRLSETPFTFQSDFLDLQGIFSVIPGGLRFKPVSARASGTEGRGHMVYQWGSSAGAVINLKSAQSDFELVLDRKEDGLEGTAVMPVLEAGDIGLLAAVRELAAFFIRTPRSLTARDGNDRATIWRARIGRLLSGETEKGGGSVTVTAGGASAEPPSFEWTGSEGTVSGTLDDPGGLDPAVAAAVSCVAAALGEEDISCSLAGPGTVEAAGPQ